jgi:hypothetical protein
LLPIFLLPFFSILAALIRFLNPDQVSQSAQVVLRLELRSTFCLPRIGLDFRWTLHFASHVLDWILIGFYVLVVQANYEESIITSTTYWRWTLDLDHSGSCIGTGSHISYP